MCCFEFQKRKNIFHFVLQADADVEQFLKETHSFDEYAKEISKYKRFVEEITYNLDKVREITLVGKN